MLVRDPERAWSVASLASEVAMSRSAFAARFADPPCTAANNKDSALSFTRQST